MPSLPELLAAMQMGYQGVTDNLNQSANNYWQQYQDWGAQNRQAMPGWMNRFGDITEQIASMPGADYLIPQVALTNRGLKWTQNAVKDLGFTDNPYQAGFIIPKGEMINLRDPQIGNWLHHRSIEMYKPKGYGAVDDPVHSFMKESSAVRMRGYMQQPADKNVLFLEFMEKPSKEQINKIKEIYPYFEGGFQVDMLNKEGKDLGYYYGDSFSEFLQKINKTYNK